MEQLLFFILATVGFTIIITKSKRFKPFRDLFLDITINETFYNQTFRARLFWFFQCPLCIGVWVGFLVRVGMITWLHDITQIQLVSMIDIFLHGCIGGVMSLLGYLILNKLGFDKL